MNKTFPGRAIRLQFNLRMLLLLMAVVGIGLAIFRWPWEETTVRQDGVTLTTHYHRGWNGKPIKHGIEREVSATQHMLREAWYAEGELRREREFNSAGVLRVETLYFPERGEKLVKKFVSRLGLALVVETRSWNNNQRERKEWKTPGGEVLESHEGEYVDVDEFQITRWNDRSVVEESENLLVEIPQPTERLEWLTPMQPEGYDTISYLGDATFEVRAAKERTLAVPLHVYSPGSNPRGGLPGFSWYKYNLRAARFRSGQSAPSTAIRASPFAQDTLDFAHKIDATLQCRFGVLCIVPISSENLAPGDPTGALAVEFPAGSTQAEEWLERVIGMDQGVVPHAKRVHRFFAETSIEVDASQVSLPAEYRPNMPDSTYLRTRRDTLGMFLWNHHLRVEQLGTKLIITKRPRSGDENSVKVPSPATGPIARED